MKTRGMIIGMATIFFVGFFGDVSWADGRIRDRQLRQRARIDHGVRSGDITKKEYVHLHREQKKIRKVAGKAWADNHLGCGEKRHLEKMQNRASRHIYHAKRNPWSAQGKWTKRNGPKHHRPYYKNYCPKPLKRHIHRRHHGGYVGSHLGGLIAEPGWLFAWSIGLH
jgi:hypothetical protein